MTRGAHAEGLGERPALEQHRGLGYRPPLDGIRAVAILPVVGFHAWVFPKGGYLGVDVFFALSGFLITTLLVQEAQASGRISLGHFYLRRALRLVPALVVAAAAYVLLSAIEVAANGRTHSGTPLHDALLGALYGVLYIQNLLITAGTAMPVAIGHLWSLATEEQFYLLWPLALVLALRARVSYRLLGAALVVAILALNVDRDALIATHASFRRMYFAPDGHFDVILVGCLAGLWFATGGAAKTLAPRWIGRSAAAFGAAAIALVYVLPYVTSGYRLELALLPLLAVGTAALILAVVVHGRSPAAVLLSLPPLVFVGKISYALYLWHPIVLFAFARIGSTAEVALAFAAATASYYVVELPFLRLKRRDRARVDARTERGGDGERVSPSVAV